MKVSRMAQAIKIKPRKPRPLGGGRLIASIYSQIADMEALGFFTRPLDPMPQRKRRGITRRRAPSATPPSPSPSSP